MLTLNRSSSLSFGFLSPNLDHGNNHHGDRIQLQVRGILFGHCGGTRMASQYLAATAATAESLFLRVNGQGQRAGNWVLRPTFWWWIATTTGGGADPAWGRFLSPRWASLGEVRLRFDKIAMWICIMRSKTQRNATFFNICSFCFAGFWFSRATTVKVSDLADGNDPLY